jgi:DNA-binding NtrC family response regulator
VQGVAKVLIADDDRDVLEALRLLIAGAGYEVVPVGSPGAAEAAVQAEDPDVALLDMNYARDTTSGREGQDLITRLRRSTPDLPIVVMTAWSSVSSAVEAIQRGAQDYVEKPWSNERLLTILRAQIALRGEKRQTARLRAQSAREHHRELPELIATSRPMQQVMKQMDRIAAYDANVLITGEHGTGKDLVARWIHAASKRAQRAFVPVNAGALPEGLFESELFGHVKGAFTDAVADRVGCFELADGGTLFLDEIGTMPVSQQAKLLRILQTGEVQPVGSARPRRCDVRVLSATNVDIAKAVTEGAFREDLLYRLNTVEIHLPPLRERIEDVALLARHYLEHAKQRYARPELRFASDVETALSKHSWPGNVRELAHVIERAVLFAESDIITTSDLSFGRASFAPTSLEGMTLSEAEAYLIRKAIERTGNALEAAQLLGLSRSGLYRRLQALGIKVQE